MEVLRNIKQDLSLMAFPRRKVLTAYSTRGQLMYHEDASPDANLMKTVLVLLGYLIPQQKFCKQNFRTPAWVDNVISLHGS